MANQVRKIIHVDMDAFYASVEQRDTPEYRGKPLVVGGSATQRGVVAAASYEARKYGIHSAMPSKLAIARCPNLIFAKPRFEVYRAISTQIHNIFRRYTDTFEPVALDEAYLDVTENKQRILKIQNNAVQRLKELREKHLAQTSELLNTLSQVLNASKQTQDKEALGGKVQSILDESGGIDLLLENSIPWVATT